MQAPTSSSIIRLGIGLPFLNSDKMEIDEKVSEIALERQKLRQEKKDEFNRTLLTRAVTWIFNMPGSELGDSDKSLFLEKLADAIVFLKLNDERIPSAKIIYQEAQKTASSEKEIILRKKILLLEIADKTIADPATTIDNFFKTVTNETDRFDSQLDIATAIYSTHPSLALNYLRSALDQCDEKCSYQHYNLLLKTLTRLKISFIDFTGYILREKPISQLARRITDKLLHATFLIEIGEAEKTLKSNSKVPFEIYKFFLSEFQHWKSENLDLTEDRFVAIFFEYLLTFPEFLPEADRFIGFIDDKELRDECRMLYAKKVAETDTDLAYEITKSITYVRNDYQQQPCYSLMSLQVAFDSFIQIYNQRIESFKSKFEDHSKVVNLVLSTNIYNLLSEILHLQKSGYSFNETEIQLKEILPSQTSEFNTVVQTLSQNQYPQALVEAAKIRDLYAEELREQHFEETENILAFGKILNGIRLTEIFVKKKKVFLEASDINFIFLIKNCLDEIEKCRDEESNKLQEKQNQRYLIEYLDNLSFTLSTYSRIELGKNYDGELRSDAICRIAEIKVKQNSDAAIKTLTRSKPVLQWKYMINTGYRIADQLKVSHPDKAHQLLDSVFLRIVGDIFMRNSQEHLVKFAPKISHFDFEKALAITENLPFEMQVQVLIKIAKIQMSNNQDNHAIRALQQAVIILIPKLNRSYNTQAVVNPLLASDSQSLYIHLLRKIAILQFQVRDLHAEANWNNLLQAMDVETIRKDVLFRIIQQYNIEV